MTKKKDLCIIKKKFKEQIIILNYFDVSARHIITAANNNEFTISTLHPTRKIDEHVIIYILEGEWKIGQGNEKFYVQKGDTLILSAGLSHYGISPCTPGTKTMYIHVSHNAGDKADKSTNDNKIIIQSKIPASANPNVKNCFEKIIYYANSCKNPIIASVYFDVLLCELKNCINQTTQSSLAEKIRQLIVFSNKILKNTEIAKSFNVSIKTAENAFKNTFHTTIHQYVIDTKIEQAEFYLVNFPDMKLYEIATNLGFYDEFHLSRHFKKAVGVSPGEYKRIKRRDALHNPGNGKLLD